MGIAYIAFPLVGSLSPEYPGIPTLKADLRLVEIEERKAKPIDAPGGCLPDAMTEDEPTFGRLDGGRTEPNLICNPPPAAT
jgi:hypothetical protein